MAKISVSTGNRRRSSGLTSVAEDDAFLQAALQYPRDVFIASEVIRCVPSALAGPASWLATRGHAASKHMFTKLVPMIEERLRCGNAVSNNDRVRTLRDLVSQVLIISSVTTYNM
jgi:hypothetical protein